MFFSVFQCGVCPHLTCSLGSMKYSKTLFMTRTSTFCRRTSCVQTSAWRTCSRPETRVYSSEPVSTDHLCSLFTDQKPVSKQQLEVRSGNVETPVRLVQLEFVSLMQHGSVLVVCGPGAGTPLSVRHREDTHLNSVLKSVFVQHVVLQPDKLLAELQTEKPRGRAIHVTLEEMETHRATRRHKHTDAL